MIQIAGPEATREEIAVGFILLGHISVDEECRFWRRVELRGRDAVPCELPFPKRIDAPNDLGYYTFGVTWARRNYRVLAHRAVWVYHNGPIPDGLEVNHKDGDKANNRLGNLELLTHRENMIHSYTVLGNVCPVVAHLEATVNDRLSWEDVQEIRRWAAEGVPQKEIARRKNVTGPAVSFIVNGKRRKRR